MQIIVKNADWSANNLGTIQTIGVKNLNVGEGTNHPKIFPTITETATKFGCELVSSVENPISQQYVHRLIWTSDVHNSSTQNVDQVYVDGDVGIKSPSVLRLGFWINKTLYDSVINEYNTGYVQLYITAGANAVGSVSGYNIFTPGIYNVNISEGQLSKITSEKITVKHLAEVEINGETWVYVSLRFDIVFVTSNTTIGIQCVTARFSKYLYDKSLSQIHMDISGITLTNSEKELEPYFVYPFA